MSAHHLATIRTIIAGRGAQRFYLPPSSPALAPIERAWSPLKTYWRAAKARTREALELALQQALTTITAADAHGWFTQCGYTVSELENRSSPLARPTTSPVERRAYIRQ